jgi:hypothetical protein
MKSEDIILYGPIYRGHRMTYNSKKGRGMMVEGIAIEVDNISKLIIIRDKENFPHSIDLNTSEKI